MPRPTRSTLFLLALLLPAALATVAAGADDNTPVQKDTLRLQEVEVVGTRNFQHLRHSTTGAVDVVPIAPQARLGSAELTQILQHAAPSFHSVTQTQTDGNDHVDLAQLRGLGADQTLVLINGKRRHTSALVHVGDNVNQGTAGVDLNSIPAAAIERVEVLRDGAAAQYGSDAIAGVLNIVLKSSTGGGTVSALGGGTTHSDGGGIRTDVNYGWALGAKGFLDVTGEFRHREPTNRVGRWNGNVYYGNLFNFGSFGPNGEYNSQGEYQADLDKIAARGFDLDNVQRIGDSKITNSTVFLNAAYPLADNVEAYAFGGYTVRSGEASAFFRFPADPAVSDTTIYPNGYLPLITSDIRDQSFSLGVRGTRAGWDGDLSNTFGSNSFDFGVDHTLNASLQGASPTKFDAGGLYYGQNTTRLDLTRRIGAASGGPWAALALGAELRIERYRITAGEEASWRDYNATTSQDVPLAGGSQGFPGFTPANAVNKTRNNAGVYADLEAHPVAALTIGGAGRYESYSDFDGKLVGKVAAQYKAGERVTFRAGLNNGFRAPSLHQVYTNKVSTFFVGNVPNQVGLFNNTSAVARALGVAKLKPETSVNYSAGVSVEPVDRLRVSVDGYVVDVTDRILVSGVISRDALTPGTLDAFPDIQSVQFFSNAANTRTRGVDAEASYPVILGQRVLTLTVAANFNETRIRGAIRTPAGLGDAPLLDAAARSYLETALPSGKLSASARYATGGFSVLARGTRYGSVQSINLYGPNETVPAAVLTDLNVGYARGRWNASVGANNVFDVSPPRQDYANSYFGIFQYSRVVPYSIDGRYVYGALSVGI
jgi:iron complex outermembrane receptor protein